MIIEYKAPTVAITPLVFEQVCAYNHLLHVDYLVVSNGLEHYCARTDENDRIQSFMHEIPDYLAL